MQRNGYELKISTENSAFHDVHFRPREVARILRELADKIDRSDSIEFLRLYDINGNKVGYASPMKFDAPTMGL